MISDCCVLLGKMILPPCSPADGTAGAIFLCSRLLKKPLCWLLRTTKPVGSATMATITSPSSHPLSPCPNVACHWLASCFGCSTRLRRADDCIGVTSNMQLTVYHYNGGPCYRCLFPAPPPTEACQRCSDSGVLGVVVRILLLLHTFYEVPGVIGCLQALEAIKIASAVGEPLSGRMLLFDALSGRIRTVKLRGRSLHCDVCGENPALTPELFRSFSYENFTRSPFFDLSKKTLQLLPETARISSREYKERVDGCEPHVLVDVRPAHHYRIAALTNSISIPLPSLEEKLSAIDSAMKGIKQGSSSHASLYVICRRGNDSQRAVKFLQENGFPMAKDIIGGLESWSQEVDAKFPVY
ncbi:hypothetical protein Taro_035011 [Colocasia esculenta]|uniref:Rhodanese domain-containing protein n=1 Tax=Colocasia esculenta TaxID=4460 RepID=A0A843VXW5_COLES|nr:hypothetical protein [Colocasia esculenta]